MPYRRPQDSRHFDATKSSTFVAQTSQVPLGPPCDDLWAKFDLSLQTFDLNYADGSHLRGFSGVDQVYMGDYKATSPFGTCDLC